MAEEKTTPAADTKSVTPFSVENLTVRDHLDADKHFIGDALAAPSQQELAQTIGSVTSTGFSPIVARADHAHKIDPSLLPSVANYTPTLSNLTLGSGSAQAAFYISTPVQGVTNLLIHVQVSLIFGTGGTVGDVNVTLPIASFSRFMGYGWVGVTGFRYKVVWNTLSSSSTAGLVRPEIYRPTDANTHRPIEISSIALGSILPAVTWTAGDYLMLYGDYYSVAS